MDVVRAADRAADRYAVAREALAEVPLAVVLLAAGLDGERSCATGTAMYVSFAPPRLAIALHPGSRTCRLVEASGAFSISVLRADQVDVATAAGRSAAGDDKFAALGLPVVESDASPGVPALAGAAFVVWCSVVERLVTGDHVLFVGEVIAFGGERGTAPLLRHARRYAARGAWLSETAPEGYPT